MKIEAGDFRKVNVSLIALLVMAGVGAVLREPVARFLAALMRALS